MKRINTAFFIISILVLGACAPKQILVDNRNLPSIALRRPAMDVSCKNNLDAYLSFLNKYKDHEDIGKYTFDIKRSILSCYTLLANNYEFIKKYKGKPYSEPYIKSASRTVGESKYVPLRKFILFFQFNDTKGMSLKQREAFALKYIDKRNLFQFSGDVERDKKGEIVLTGGYTVINFVKKDQPKLLNASKNPLIRASCFLRVLKHEGYSQKYLKLDGCNIVEVLDSRLSHFKEDLEQSWYN